MHCCTGIVLYNPELQRLRENVLAILPQSKPIIFVDNGSNNINEIASVLSEFSDTILIINNKNFGIAAALNQLISRADEMGYDWILTLDQDSICSDNIMRIFENCAIIHDNAAIICPYVIDINLMTLDDYKNLILPEYQTVNKCITSGSFTNIQKAKQVGYFNAELFIDHVDHDLCYRLKLAGYSIICANKAYILHEVGKMKTVYILPKLGCITGIKWFTRPKHITNHSPVRVYYYTRNGIYIARKYHKLIGHIPSKGYHYLRGMSLKFLVEKDRLKKVASFIKGCWDGLWMPID